MGQRGVARTELAGVLLLFAVAGGARPQAQAAGEKALTFDVASVRQNKGDDLRVSSNVPLGPGDVYVPTGGVFSARSLPLMVYVIFAYRMTDAEVDSTTTQMPEWVLHERFDVEARTDKRDASKDELRLMVRSLLAERFGLRMHSEMKEVAVYRLVSVKGGVTGPGLRPHPAEMSCSPTGNEMKAEWPEAVTGGFPRICGAILGLPAKAEGDYRLGGSNIAMGLLASSLSGWGGLGKPVVDGTGTTGRIDFVLEFAPATAPDRDVDAGGPPFREALKTQLGLKLEAGRAMVEFLVLDRVGRLVEN